MDMPKSATPTLAQWFAIKARHLDALIFFRMGDFFELFFADAETASAALDIALTHRGEHEGKPVPMCGVPAAAAELYLARLIRRGFRVAVAEQLEKASERRGNAPIRRDVVRLVTPGTLTDEALLEPARPNLLLSLAGGPGVLGAAWIDISTGLFETESLAPAALPDLLGRLDPAEILAPETLALGEFMSRRAPESPAPPPPVAARQALAKAFKVGSLEAFGSFTDEEAAAGAVALAYACDTQGGRVPRLSPPASQQSAAVMAMDAATRASLDLLAARDGSTGHTLFSAIDHTQTAAGARALAQGLAAPLTDPSLIAARQDAWCWLRDAPDLAASLRAALAGTPDLSRALGRLSVGRGGARDLASLRDGLKAAHRAAELLATRPRATASARPPPASFATANSALGGGKALAATLSAALAGRLPARADEGGAIAPGFDAALDEERRLSEESRRVIAGLERELAGRLGVGGLKIRYHAQLGYVIEVPAAAAERLKAEPGFALRQGMANGARFSTPELTELDQRISSAAERALARERAILAELSAAALAEAEVIAAAAGQLAALDVALSAARLAEGGRWCRPRVFDGNAFRIRAGRHPVVEAALGLGGRFTPNDCDLGAEHRVALLTGPNMAGKSTFLRQNALIAILAQAGLPVPAEEAEIGVIDRLFSRVGAADDLARGRSTFMVEMTETAAILRQAGPASLVVVDEIGRGTATLDGLAIAWAVLEALHNSLRCRTLFATHFHELARLSTELPRLRPLRMQVMEGKNDVTFLHEVAEGAAERSFGVAVAKLAGVPAPVVVRAARLLALLEERGATLTAPAQLPLFAAFSSTAKSMPEEVAGQPPTAPSADPLHAAVAELAPDMLTPREALEILYRLKALLPVPEAGEPLASARC
ncbi:MAG TPA: DNA mismatch repair protein MutS [Acetobacteraceae bacterium]|nr:DNA mismatch repair protein MutS [Acetobacteraceae bacterium]